MTGLDVGTPSQSVQLLIDTGSGVTHVASKGCGSACGLLLPPTVGFNASASSTAQALPCGARCSCPQCTCSTQGAGGPSCVYSLRYVDGSSSSGGLISDVIDWAGRPVEQLFGLEARQTGKVQGQSIQGLLALDRTPTSFIGQVGASAAGGGQGAGPSCRLAMPCQAGPACACATAWSCTRQAARCGLLRPPF